jgi:nitrite reductase (NADH) small subunit
MSTTHIVCRAEELPPGSRKIVQIGKKSIGVFNVNGTYYALLNFCPHQHAPLCLGKVTGYSPTSERVGEYPWAREGEIIRCPWHGWEFDITNGKSIFNPHKVRTASYPAGLEKCAGHGAALAESAEGAESEPEPSVETFPVEVEGLNVVVRV